MELIHNSEHAPSILQRIKNCLFDNKKTIFIAAGGMLAAMLAFATYKHFLRPEKVSHTFKAKQFI